MHKPLLANRLSRWLAAAAFGLLAAPAAQAQLAGTKAIPGDYATVAAAITDLNAQGVGAGGVTFNIAAGYTETFASPTAGAITATGTAANPVVFQKSGTGANPKITAGVGTSTSLDALISLAGSDYVTFDGLELAESAANTTAATQMEFGFALFRPSPTDGCQNNIIRNCIITLNKTNTGTFGIYGAASTAALATSVAATSPAGAHSGNKVNGNIITNAASGMYFTASSSTTLANYDVNNEIGVTAGNQVYNFGTTASGWGIGGNYQGGLKIVNNLVNNTLSYAGGTTSPVAATTVTSTLRGIYGNAAPSASIDITGNVVTLASGATTSLLTGIDNGIGSTPASNTVNITGNTVQITYATATTAAISGIANTGAATTVNITGNTVQNSTAAAATTATFVGITSSAGSAINLNNNTVSNNVIAGTGTLTLISSSLIAATSPVSISNNTLTGNSKTPSGTTSGASLLCITLGSAATTITGNTITNNTIVTASTSTTVGTLTGINSSASSTTIENLSNNVITGLSISGTSTATTHTVRGIVTAATGSTDVQTLSQNTIGGLSIASGSGTVTGISVPNGGGTGSIISRNKIYDLSAAGTAGSATGLLISTGGTYTVANNLIGDLRAPAATGLTALAGLTVSGGTAVNAYYNTLYLNATGGATFGTSGIYLNSTSTTLDARNNVVVNKSTAAGTGGYTAALRRVSGTAGTAPANLASTTNNNLYYAGTPSATNLIYVEGTTTATNAQQTIAAYRTLVATRESNSVTEDVPFLSTTGTAATFLHVSPTTPTQVESAGTPISGISTDFDGDARNATTPDLGADEGTFQPLDITGPSIVFTPLSFTGSTANRTLAVTITDPSGISTTAPPRLFYRKGTTGAFISALATSVSGSTYTFTFDYAALGGVALGDVVQYYVVAQDVPGNVSSNPAGGTFGTNPATIYQYTVNALSGVYYVGTSTSPAPSRTYATLTAAATAYNSTGLTGAVTFLLLDNAYSAATGETFPVAFINNPDASATNTLTIRPNTGVTATVTAAGSVLVLGSTRYVTLDGSNTAGGTTRNLTLANTALTAGTYGLGMLLQNGQAQGNQFATVRNVNVVGGGATTNATLGIVLSGADHDNVTIQNNSITGVTTGIQAFGTALVSAGGLDNLVVSDNVVGPATAAAAANINGTGMLISNAVAPSVTSNTVQNVVGTSTVLGMQVQNASTPTISGNTVLNVLTTGGGATGFGLFSVTGGTLAQNLLQGLTSNSGSALSAGLLVGSGTTGVVIDRNRLLGLTEVNTGGNGVKGIEVQTGQATANVRISNNFVQVTGGSGYSGTTYSNLGIRLSGTQGAIGLYYNSVNMTGTDTYNIASISAGLAVLVGSTGLDIRNNIFRNTLVNSGNTGAKAYAFYSTAPATAFTSINYNDYFVSGTQGVLAYFGTADVTTLAALRTATTQDANSVNADPQFVSATDLHSTAAALNNVGTPIGTVTTDIDGETRSATTPDIGADEFTPPSCPIVSNLAFASITATSATVTFAAPTGANSYTVTYTPAGGTATTLTPNPTASPVALTGLTANTVYTVTVTTNCTGLSSPATTGTFRTACTPPTYATLPATEGFESTWLSRCDTREVPTTNWLNTPLTGENSWRREDDGAAANWTSPTSGAYTPAGQNSAHSARFHAYYAPSGSVGTLDYYVDLSPAGTKRLSFGYLNQSTGGSKVEVLLSTDGGATFTTTPLLSVSTSAAFSTRTVDLTATSATSVIRFRATSDYGSNDIGLDNVQVSVLPAIDLAATALATPTATQGCYGSAETVTVTVTNFGTQPLNFGTNPATVTATVTTPSGPQTLTGSITTGTLASGATQNVALTPPLNMTAVGTYTFAIAATVTGDGNTTNDALTPAPTRTVAAPVAGTLAPASASICVSGTAALTLTGAANGSIQYQSSPDNVTFTDISGATGTTYTTPVLTSTTYYRAQVRCGTAVATSNVSTITVTNPLVASTNTPVTICAGSAATLTATASSGSSVRFFDAATGGTALTTTTAGSFTTPALTANATYYAEAYSTSSSVAGLASNATSNGTFAQSSLTDYPLGFAVTQAGTLASVDVYPSATGALTIRLYSVAGTQPAGAATAVAGSDVTITVTAAQVGTRVTVPLNYTLAAGDYRISNPTGTLGRFSTYTGTYPLTSGPLTVKGSYNAITSTSFSNTTYNSFFNLTFSGECVGAPRTAIQVNVTQPATASFATATGSSCGTSAVTLAGAVGGSATGGTYTSSGTGTFAPNASTLTATYTPSAADVAAGSVTITLTSAGSTPCPAATATFALSISPAPVASFSYPATATYCAGSTGTVTPTLGSGATAGTFSSTSGLTLNAATGAITLSSSAAGTYTVTNTVAASGACAAVSATTTVTVTPATSAAFAYAGSTFCASGTNPTPTVTGTAGGTFSSASGLILNASTGAIALSSSTPGTYTVTYTVAGPCGSSSTQSVTITTAPLATFSYGTSATFCVSGTTNPAPSFGAGASGGVFSSTAGLTLNATTGAITLSSSTPGTYTVTNTIAASSGCAVATATAQVTITAAPVAAFSYGTASTFCVSGTTAPAVVLGTGAAAGTFTSTAGLTLNATTGAITLSSSTPGTYTVTNTIAAAGGCAAATATAQVTITAAPVAAFSYGTAAGCVGSATAVTPTLGTGATAGTFSSTTGLTINAATGAITLSTSTAGTYTVTNTVAAAGGCAAATATTTFTVNPRPATPTISVAYNGTTTTLTSSATTGNQFYLGPNAVAGATGQTLVLTGLPAQLGSYTVTTTNANGCVSLPSTPLVVTSAKNGIAGTSLRLYPNPTPSGQVTLELTGYRLATQLTVLDALGRVIVSELLPANTGTVAHPLDLTGVATGVYLLRLRNADGVETRRLVRE